MARDTDDYDPQREKSPGLTGENLSSGSFFDMVRGSDVAATPGELTGIDEAETFEEESDAVAREIEASISDVSDDTTDMPHEARRVLVYLMRQGAVIAAQKPKLFEAICRYEPLVRRHLSEVYLRLTLDRKAGVAFVARYEEDATDAEAEANEEFVSLISKRTLSLYDTLLLLVLRRHYQERESAGEQKVTVDVERLESSLTPFLPLTHHARADRKKLNAAIQKLIQRKVLAATRSSEDRYEITPIIRYVVDAAFLESMLGEYLRLAGESDIVIDPSVVSDDLADDAKAIQDDLLGGLS